jgi:hypothetical protein
MTADLEQQVVELTHQVAELRSLLGARPPADVPAQLTRRGLLTALPALAMAGAGAMALTGLAAGPAAASPGDPVLQGMGNNAGSATTSLTSTAAIAWNVSNGMQSQTLHVGDGVADDNGDLNVLTNPAYTAHVNCRHVETDDFAKGGSAIYADGFMAPAIVVDAIAGKPKGPKDPNTKPGLGILVHGHGVSGGIDVATQIGAVFEGLQANAATKVGAATIITHGLGRGLLVESVNPKNAAATLTGANAGTGIGVLGVGSANGRGGEFAGGKAPVRLVPDPKAATHPAVGQAGDLFVDTKHRLWFCKGGATWAQVV